MNLNRSKNAIFNIIWGGMNKFVGIILPFFVRSVLIFVLGVEYLGLDTLFISILQVLNLAELGIGSAIVFSMYKPVAENNKETICALLNLYRKLYMVIGSCVLLIGLAILPFLDNLIKGNYPTDINLYLLYLVYLLNTVAGYFVFGYKSALIYAYQKNGIISNINTIVSILQNSLQVVLLLVFSNYLLFIVTLPIFTIVNNLLISTYVTKMFPEFKSKGKLDKGIVDDIKIRVKGLMITRICNMSRIAFNSIFISSLLGLTTLALYSNYYYVMATILSILSIISSSLLAGIGNSMVLDSVEKNYNDMRKFNFIYSWIGGFFTITLLCLYQPFMKLWLGESMMFSFDIVVAFCGYFYVMTLGGIRSIYHDAAGLWWQARYRALFETIFNVILSLILTIKLGVLGTILGTLISLLIINYGYGTQIVFKHYFKGYKVRYFYYDHLKYTIVIIFACLITYFCTNLLPENGLLSLLIKGVVCFILPNSIFYFVYRKHDMFIQSKDLFSGIVKNSKLSSGIINKKLHS